MSTSVPSLATFLAEIPEYRNAQGKRYSLVALLIYVCVAMLCGRRGCPLGGYRWRTPSGSRCHVGTCAKAAKREVRVAARRLTQPVHRPDEMERGSNQQVLQPGFRFSNVACLP